MKVVPGNVTLIFPFVSPDGQEVSSSTCLIVYPNSNIKIVDCGPVVITPEAARKLAQALLHAAGVAEAGRE